MSIPYIPYAPTRESIFRNDFFLAGAIGVLASGVTFLLAYSLGWLTGPPNWFEVIAATLNYGATYLSIKQRRFAYTLGFVASAFWAIAFYQYGLIASSILSLYLVGQLVYGYFRWGPDGSTRPVHKFEWKWFPVYALATAVTYFGAVAISTAFGGTFAFWDAAILVTTIWAQFMLDNKVLGAWYVWGLVNIIGVTLYATSGAPFAAVQQFLFGIANIWGYLAWRKSMHPADTLEVVEDSSGNVGFKRLSVETGNLGQNFSEDPENQNGPNNNSGLTVRDSSVYKEAPVKVLHGPPPMTDEEKLFETEDGDTLWKPEERA